MNIAPEKILRYLTRIAVPALFCSGFIAQCANPMAPQGGPRDSLPPVVVAVSPQNGSTNFHEKRIYIEFDEYVKLKDQQKEFFTSPKMEKSPILMIRGRGIQIDIQDTLAENTTYSLNFGSSIEDNNEGNPLHGYRYVFSTGAYIDSMVMSGYTVDAFKKDSVSKTMIFFYAEGKDSFPDYDSTVFNAVPDAVGRAEGNGIFIAENLKPIPYRVYAVQDDNNNQRYEPGVDGIGFLDGVYNPADMPAFDVWYDTTRMYVNGEPQLYFRMFKDEQFRRQYLSGQARPLQHKVILSFGAKYPQIDSLVFEGIDSASIVTEYLKPTRDSIAFWLNVPSEQLPDTIRGSITYMRHDSLSNLVPETKDLVLGWKLFETREQQREREKKEKEREQAISEGREPTPEPNPFKVTVESTATVNPEKNIPFVFDYPLASVDTAGISVIRTEADKQFRVRWRIRQDTAEIRRWTISAPWANGHKYQIEILPGAFRNVAGQTNDTLKTEFTVMDTTKYAAIILNVKGKTPESRYVLQLLDQSGNTIIEEKRDVSTGTYTFRYIDPGVQRVRVIEDMNGNGQWDKGNLVDRLQPERVEMFLTDTGDEEITTRAGWDMSYDVNMETLFAPITMEGIALQIRRAEQLRIRKYLEDKAKNPEKYRKDDQRQPGGRSGSGGFGGSGGFNPTGGFNIR